MQRHARRRSARGGLDPIGLSREPAGQRGQLVRRTIAQTQRLQHLLAGLVGVESFPPATSAQRLRQIHQPLRQRPGCLQAHQQIARARRTARQQLRVRPGRSAVRQAERAGQILQLRHLGHAAEVGLFEPVEHVVHAGLAVRRPQQAHELGRGVGRGKLPAGFVAHRQPGAIQQGADAAGQQPVVGHQRHRTAPSVGMVQGAGGGTLGFVFGIATGVQLHSIRSGALFVQSNRNGTVAPVRQQRRGQRIGLEALQDHQRIEPGAGLGQRRPQYVGGVPGSSSPDQRQRSQQRLPLQRRADRQGVGAQGIGPGLAFSGCARRGQRRELARRLHQPGDHHGPERRIQPAPHHPLQQVGRHERIARHVARQVGDPGGERLEAAGPVAAGLKPRRKAGGMGQTAQARRAPASMSCA